MRKLFSVLFIITIFSLSTVGSAQDAMDLLVPCGELAQEDCDMLTESNRVMAMLGGASFDVAMQMGLSGLEDTPDMVFDMNIGGSYEGDWSQFISNFSPERLTAIASDPTAYAELIQDMMSSFSMNLIMSMSAPEELLEADYTASVFTFNMLMIDGVIYFNFDEIKSQLPAEEATELPDGWLGFDFARWMGAFARIGASIEDQQYMLDQIEQVIIANQFADVTRLDDEQAEDGATLAVFSYDYDISAMMRSPEYQAYLLDSMRPAMREGSEERSGASFNTMMEMMATMMDGLSITATSKINTENLYQYEASFDFAWDSSPIMTNVVAGVRGFVAGIFGKFAEPNPTVNGPAMFIRGTVLMGDFDDIEPITAPEDATVVRLNDLFKIFFEEMSQQ